ncbi:hypothetical protein [Neomoorella thermoacetica]|nr:hypothetical protein [Moorella thermoacetica]APC09493.1 hypothetical protein MTJW_23440 [Moorella thermoacetica]OIQ59175.1 hypothetical protein MTIN_24320 [Moorella thermoacetica]
MTHRWLWLRALAILAVAAFVFWQRTATGQPGPYEARELAVMGGEARGGKEILEDLARGQGAGVYHLEAEGDVAPDAGVEKIIGVTLSKDRGMLGVFRRGDGQPVVLATLDTLPLQEVKVVQLETGRNAVLIRELLDESFGAYFLSTFYALYTWEDGKLQEIWRKVAGNEERWNKKWLAQGEGWQGVSEQVTTDFTRSEGKLAIKTISNQTLWSAPAATGPRTKVQSRTVTHTYRWEPAWKAMVMAEGRVNAATALKERRGNKYVDRLQLAAGEKVAVLEDEDLLAWLRPGEPSYWRVKVRNGQVGYILKSYLDLQPGP